MKHTYHDLDDRFDRGLTDTQVVAWILSVAAQDGGDITHIVKNTDGAPTVFDAASGRAWKIKLEEI